MNSAIIIHAREKMNIVHVSDNIVGSFVLGSSLSVLKPKTGSPVSVNSASKNHLYAGNNSSLELNSTSCNGATNNGLVVNFFSSHRKLFIVQLMVIFWLILPLFLIEKFSVILFSPTDFAQRLELVENMFHLPSRSSMDLFMSESQPINRFKDLFTSATIVNILFLVSHQAIQCSRQP